MQRERKILSSVTRPISLWTMDAGVIMSWQPLLPRGAFLTPPFQCVDERGRVLNAYPGYKDAEQFKLFLAYFSEDAYKEKSWEEYREAKSGYQRSGYLSRLAASVTSAGIYFRSFAAILRRVQSLSESGSRTSPSFPRLRTSDLNS